MLVQQFYHCRSVATFEGGSGSEGFDQGVLGEVLSDRLTERACPFPMDESYIMQLGDVSVI
jgi:hypothetical protein